MSLEGKQAPDFTVERTDGGTVTLSETTRTGPTAIVLNRGYWCSYCAEQLQTFSELEYDLWRNHGVTVLPVLGDDIPRLREMRDRFGLELQLCSDPDLSVAEAYTGTEDHDRFGDIPIAGTFLVDSDGVVQYAQVSENPADRTYANYVRHLVKNGLERPYE
jgi:peroxiredoxin